MLSWVWRKGTIQKMARRLAGAPPKEAIWVEGILGQGLGRSKRKRSVSKSDA